MEGQQERQQEVEKGSDPETGERVRKRRKVHDKAVETHTDANAAMDALPDEMWLTICDRLRMPDLIRFGAACVRCRCLMLDDRNWPLVRFGDPHDAAYCLPLRHDRRRAFICIAKFLIQPSHAVSWCWRRMLPTLHKQLRVKGIPLKEESLLSWDAVEDAAASERSSDYHAAWDFARVRRIIQSYGALCETMEDESYETNDGVKVFYITDMSGLGRTAEQFAFTRCAYRVCTAFHMLTTP